MGIHHLWHLLDAVGRRVSLESLSTKTLAVDASIWLIQFIKAMRDAEGQRMDNAHLLGTFRRVTKLLYHKIKPVFVFDGGTPILKLKTLAKRRQIRNDQQLNLKKTAQRLFLNQLKQKKGKLPSDHAIEPTFQLLEEPDEVQVEDVVRSSSEEEMVDDEQVEEFAKSIYEDKDDKLSDTLRELPPAMMKEFVGKLQREHRQQARTSFMPLAGKPNEYSQAQLQNFLKTSSLNRKIKQAKDDANKQMNQGGMRIQSDDQRRYTYTLPSEEVEEAAKEITRANGKRTNQIEMVEEPLDKKLKTGDAMEEAFLQKAIWESKLEQQEVGTKPSLEKQETICLSSDDSDVLDENVNGPFANRKKNQTKGGQKLSISFAVDDLPNEDLFSKHALMEMEYQEPKRNDSSDGESDDLDWESVKSEESSIQKDTKSIAQVASVSPTLVSSSPERTPSSPVVVSPSPEKLNSSPKNPICKEYSPHEELPTFLEESKPEATKVHSVLEEKAALDNVMSTASNLTQWAAGALRKAISKHQYAGMEPKVVPSAHEADTHVATIEPNETSTGMDTTINEVIENSIEMPSMEELIAEEETLRKSMRQQKRDVDGLTDEMVEEVMELLQLLGVPYMVCPMEAEAQCAALEKLGLVDGIITDDSDIFAFGGKNVYKNVFAEQKYVEAFHMDDMQKELGFDQDSIISLALLLGSDYTDGVNGVGIVNATEIVNAFPGFDGLEQFRDWVDTFDPAAEVASANKKLSALDKKREADRISHLPPQERFKETHKNARRRWTLGDTFPSTRVIQAYQKPQVNESNQPFSWSKPDLGQIRNYCSRQFRWEQSRTDQIMVPLIQKVAESHIQLPMDHFFHKEYKDNVKYATIQSKRLGRAVKELTIKK